MYERPNDMVRRPFADMLATFLPLLGSMLPEMGFLGVMRPKCFPPSYSLWMYWLAAISFAWGVTSFGVY